MGSKMSKAPTGLEPPPPSGEPDELKAIDRAMLQAIAHRQRDNAPLSIDRERLLDDWVAGRLSPTDADRAAELIKQSNFAAERVLERRLVEAANAGPSVPAAVTARVLGASRPAKAETRKSFQFRLPSFSGLQWSAAGAALAATIAVAIFGFQAWQERWQSDQRIQVAMVTIDNRGALSGSTRLRSIGPQSSAPVENGFRDVDIPLDVLRRTIVSTRAADRAAAASQLMTYLPRPGNAADTRVQILIDSVLADRLDGDWRTRSVASIRIYDLDDPRTATIRRSINVKAHAGALVLITARP